MCEYLIYVCIHIIFCTCAVIDQNITTTYTRRDPELNVARDCVSVMPTYCGLAISFSICSFVHNIIGTTLYRYLLHAYFIAAYMDPL